MRGRPITIAAICADILSRTLERCSVKSRNIRISQQKIGKVVKVEKVWNKKINQKHLED